MARFSFIVAFSVTVFASLLSVDALNNEDENSINNYLLSNGFFPNERSQSMRGTSPLFAQYSPRDTVTCDKFPRVCRAKGSPGPDCCHKRCVDVMTDNLNCGECGRKCHFGEMCCGGNCVNVMYDPRNCGGCKNKCKKGSYCFRGMCSYA